MTDEKIALPSLNIARWGYEFVPGDVEELVGWADKQAAFYERVLEGSKSYHNDQAINVVQSRVNTVVGLRSLTQQLKSAMAVEGQDAQASNLIEAIKSVFQSTFIEAGLPPADSLIGSRLGIEIANDASIGLAALHAMCLPLSGRQNYNFSYWWPEIWRGFGIGAALSMSTTSATDEDSNFVAEQLKEIVNNSQAQIGRTRADAVRTLRDVRKNHTDFITKQLGFEGQHSKKLADANDAVGKLLVEANEDIDMFKDFVKSEIALKAPVTYWETKAGGHQKKGTQAGVVAVLLMIAYVIVALKYSDAAEELVGVGKDINYAGVLITGALVTLAFWLLRLVVRVFLSHQHLETDANERVAMVKTYLALKEAGQAPKDGDLAPILTALFRPANDGIVKDEAMPPVLAEFLTRSK